MSRLSFPVTFPTLMGTVVTTRGLKLLGQLNLPSHAVELRVDALKARKINTAALIAALAKRKVPVLLTLRIPEEGGQYAWKYQERRDLFLELLPHVEAIDVELAKVKVMKPVIEQAQLLNKTLVFSAHALKKPASPHRYRQWLDEFRQLAPSKNCILKIASQIDKRTDLHSLAGLLINHPKLAIAVMGLGSQAERSRLVLAALGSRLIYGYLDEPAAPGQPSVVDLKKLQI